MRAAAIFIIFAAMGMLVWGLSLPGHAGTSKRQPQGLSGTWSYRFIVDDSPSRQPGENTYTLKLTEAGKAVNGTHCFVINAGGKSDCPEESALSESRPYSVTGTVEGNSATVTIDSAYSFRPVTAYLTVSGDRMTMETSEPNDVIPMKLEFVRTTPSASPAK